MTNFNVISAKSAILVVGVVDIIILSGTFSGVRITNRSNLGNIFARTDGVNPTVNGDDSYVILEGKEKIISVPELNNIEVRIISSVAAGYSVEGILNTL